MWDQLKHTIKISSPPNCTLFHTLSNYHAHTVIFIQTHYQTIIPTHTLSITLDYTITLTYDTYLGKKITFLSGIKTRIVTLTPSLSTQTATNYVVIIQVWLAVLFCLFICSISNTSIIVYNVILMMFLVRPTLKKRMVKKCWLWYIGGLIFRH